MSEMRAALRAMARGIRSELQTRGAIPHDVTWEQAPVSSRRMYLREAKRLYRAASVAVRGVRNG